MKTLLAAVFLTQFAVMCLFVAVLHVVNTPTTNSPANTTLLPVKGNDGIVDYAKVDMLITDKLSDIPLPSVKPEKVDYDAIRSMVKDEVGRGLASLPVPKDGEKGENGSTATLPEIRSNPSSHETEWRCPGDTFWTSLLSNPILEGSCQ